MSNPDPTSSPDDAEARLRTPDDLIRAVPYLLGFHPSESLVLMGLAGSRLVVTTRMDLADLTDENLTPVTQTLSAIARGGADTIAVLVFTTATQTASPPRHTAALPFAELVAQVSIIATLHGVRVMEAMLTTDRPESGQRWWSYLCDDPQCCPPEGHVLDVRTGEWEPLAVTLGVAPARDRAALADQLQPAPIQVDIADIAAVEAVLRARIRDAGEDPARWQQPEIDALLIAARSGSAVSVTDAARFGVALQAIPVRDALWIAQDNDHVPNASWWCELGRMLPAPLSAAPFFLYGWAAWRRGDGALANLCIDRVHAIDPYYTAADLLHDAVRSGVNPTDMPKLHTLA